jgi:hypothetical protein
MGQARAYYLVDLFFDVFNPGNLRKLKLLKFFFRRFILFKLLAVFNVRALNALDLPFEFPCFKRDG